MPMFHPAAALHQPSLKEAVLQDFSRLPAALEHARQAREKQRIEEEKKTRPNRSSPSSTRYSKRFIIHRREKSGYNPVDYAMLRRPVYRYS